MSKFKKFIYDITRHYVKKYLTCNLGKVVEDDEKLICYVKRNKVKKSDYNYTIPCSGIRDEKKQVAEAYNLNKPICYIIDGFDFKKNKVYIFGYNECEVIIKNCNFGFEAYIHVNGKCTLDNTNIRTFSYLSIGANELVIKNMDINPIDVMSFNANIGFGANDKIDVIDSNIGKKNKKIKVSFFATNKLNFINSNICGKDVVCDSKSISIDENSSLTACNKINLKVNDFTSINISAPTIILNDEEITNERESIVLKRITDPLTLKRMELVNLLKKIRSECESVNLDSVEIYQEELISQPISKTLKR